MFWADNIAGEVRERFAAKIERGETLLVRDEKTASGRVHVGSMRGVAIHGMVAHVLNEQGAPAEFKYEIHDFDVMDGLPTYLDTAVYQQEMGKPLNHVPSPEPIAPNFAAYFGNEFMDVIRQTGFEPKFYCASELYESGDMDAVIRTALDRAADIRRIYKTVSGSQRPDDWYPLSVVCENCGKIGTTRVSGWDGEQVTYTCEPAMVEWASGCGHTGAMSPFGGNAKLPWKVEWPAKWKVLGVDVEGEGKDHSTKGGARDVANHVSREVFEYEPPYDIPYEFFLVGGEKMSSSKGRGASAREIADLFPPRIFRFALIGKQLMQAINVEPEGETLPRLFDSYDTVAQKYWDGVGDDDARLFELVHFNRPPDAHYLPRFSTVAYLVQMPHVQIDDEIAALKGEALTADELSVLDERVTYALYWLKTYAPERYKFEIQHTLPEKARELSDVQQRALADVLSYLQEHERPTGEELHAALHTIRKETEIEPKEFFSALYTIILGKDSGPKAGWFLSVLDRDFLLTRLREATETASPQSDK